MRRYFYLTGTLLCLLLIYTSGYAQSIKGQVVDMQDKMPVPGVSIRNVHQDARSVSDEEGMFVIDAREDELLEFSKEGFKTYKIRIPKGALPPYFKIGLDRPAAAPKDLLADRPANYREDSLKYAFLYKKELGFSKFSTIDMLKHPFSAMSKRNRQIWAFQDEYSWFQQEKYINYTFNGKLVTDLTGMEGDSLQAYMRMFRPGYEQLRNMSEYNLYGYIKETVELYRKRGPRARMGTSRGSR